MKKKDEKDYASKPHIILDAIHHVMEIDESLIGKNIKTIKHVIDAPFFQRLKGIKQLGLADMIFPTATHTRFSHSIGAAFLASKIAKKIKLKDCLPVLFAALLHDIGHGPFSHAFERVLKIKHEHWTPKFIEEFYQGKILSKSLCEQIKSLLDSNGKKIESDIISSQLDCDRLDYLLRDSHFCGVNYGRYDLDWLLNCLQRIKLYDKSERLGINYKGIGALENYLLGRRLMTLNVYYNKNVCAFESLLEDYIQYLRELIHSLPHANIKNIVGSYLYNFLKKSFDIHPKNAQSRDKFIDTTFDYYKFLTDYDIWCSMRGICDKKRGNKQLKRLSHIASCFIERKSPKMICIRNEHVDQVKNKIEEYRKLHKLEEYQVKLIHQKLTTYESKNEKSIYVFTEDKRNIDIRHFSDILSRIRGQPEERYFVRVDRKLCPDENKELYLLKYFQVC